MAVYEHGYGESGPTELEVELEDSLKLEREMKVELELELLKAKEEVTREKMSRLALLTNVETLRKTVQELEIAEDDKTSILSKLKGETENLDTFQKEMGKEAEDSSQRQVTILKNEVEKLKHMYECEFANHQKAKTALESLCNEMQEKVIGTNSKENLNQANDKSEEIANLNKEIREKSKEVQEKTLRVNELEKELQHKKDYVSEICAENKKMKSQVRTLESKNKEMNADLEEAMRDAGTQLQAASSSLDQIRNLEKNLNLVRKQLRDTEKNLKESQATIVELEASHHRELEDQKEAARKKEKGYLLISMFSIILFILFWG
uniref:Uncharacterized protein n=1 Tax=Aplanochytrium stocchinoi TaxID=215587 RepID=A0A7S3PIL8_9STRA|mmetsp:Transcript_5265/g.6213  ORF Transcript_5265/g.6213 Transcript_5265/m.6213 type:complete len:321 (+) Transcript_5265:43-1005(+)|eukprot:CAMPEP_0204865268 /NCGR_PEP_ID=MMETSP1348-20121228/7181_1 /ASSEMBLY_ACC=CAM_ASM_000700 /TAXON_ID=215587 /ORGANISM="Aplanochytrium stocchinoi, Strain GSBS06" /LENGTH=320 /DNA_ID=CAMNT_0052016361 /DNA_START=48 /DNA_END=1010 /DNA_ORIENTATION=-